VSHFVGIHNLTGQGFGINREITNQIEYGKAKNRVALFQDILTFCPIGPKTIHGLPESIRTLAVDALLRHAPPQSSIKSQSAIGDDNHAGRSAFGLYRILQSSQGRCRNLRLCISRPCAPSKDHPTRSAREYRVMCGVGNPLSAVRGTLPARALPELHERVPARRFMFDPITGEVRLVPSELEGYSYSGRTAGSRRLAFRRCPPQTILVRFFC